METVKVSGVGWAEKGWGERGRGEWAEQSMFRAVAMMSNVCHCTFLQTLRMSITKSGRRGELQALRHRGLTLGTCIPGDKCTCLVLVLGEAVQNLFFSLSFLVNRKLL